MIPAFINKWQLPHKPGVYIFQDKNGKILYVGKAINLYHRVASYFNGKPDNPKTASLVEKIANCETLEVLSDIEALILEANLIKKYLPPFNIRLTDDKDYLYIKITDEPFPRILIARKTELDDAKEYFGPFPSSKAVRATLKKLRRVFPWCTSPPKEGVKRPCFYYHLNLCPGPCAGKIDQKEYLKITRGFSQFMQGKKEDLLASLKEEMKTFAQKREFERAQATKRIIEGVEYLSQPNRAEVYLENPNFVEAQNSLAVERLQKDLKLPQLPERIECFDISNIQGQYAVGSLVVLTSGEIDKRWYRRFKINPSADGKGKVNDVAMMREVVSRRVKHPEWPTPHLVLIDGGRGQVRGAWEEISKAGWKVPVLGLAKKMEWLYTRDKEVIKLSKSSLSLRLLQKIRDEAHRFAISYHRKLRSHSYNLNVLYNPKGLHFRRT
ncbi:MAG: Excinuclease ABC subunit C [Candidatus Daviesbacteria bacterium GW2011_GWA1_41_61]|uniref:Excinuclease ABC subunit C n=1 Tax=Candidatus Daviesbacteria bacterium GW2011_GWA2_40_9 TaxID=1618424 RepID=A0A0G0U1B9_9BACT|nr:MAG: Excinuclease ABC subunit C [Candidatus Daviesbacteria bacterium GW2011_GWC1_40_9]KKR82913.1 MAG: Excinuclease ABC subunit C [Candidatus Daviesbacteria bacterium GW2011_GWA2_40_9]KKR92841.1 MAG: Excinuclease ABC subunit C [Candidatus Daviesbacteria bacterium GW2011_GWB1_41_15]KKS15385.1 MAG: Excinuclease ABC subunit C [Candidatus Daviesbacteria bacterium GW2011_GWA1_41_61]